MRAPLRPLAPMFVSRGLTGATTIWGPGGCRVDLCSQIARQRGQHSHALPNVRREIAIIAPLVLVRLIEESVHSIVSSRSKSKYRWNRVRPRKESLPGAEHGADFRLHGFSREVG